MFKNVLTPTEFIELAIRRAQGAPHSRITESATQRMQGAIIRSFETALLSTMSRSCLRSAASMSIQRPASAQLSKMRSGNYNTWRV